VDSLTGRVKRVTVYGTTQSEALEKLDRRKAEIREGLLQLEDMRLVGLLDFWLAGVKSQVAESSWYKYRDDLAPLRPHLGSLMLSEVKGLHVTHLYQAMEGAGVSSYRRKRAGSRLRQVLDEAVRLGLLRENPARRVGLPRAEEKEARFLTREQALGFLESTRGDRLHALYVTALDTGARIGELWALEWGDWNPERREIRITKSLRECRTGSSIVPPKTKSSRRTLVVTERAKEALEAHRRLMEGEGHGSPLIFCNTKGKYLYRSWFSVEIWRPAAQRAGLPPGTTFHALRHTCATLLLGGGVDVRTVSAHLGHSNPTMVLKIYGHVLPAMKAGANQVMAGVLGQLQYQLQYQAPQEELRPGCRRRNRRCGASRRRTACSPTCRSGTAPRRPCPAAA
jgi:integrase